MSMQLEGNLQNRGHIMFAEIFQPGHIVIVAVVLLILFGGPRIASLGRGFSRAVQNFRASKDGAVVKRDIGPSL